MKRNEVLALDLEYTHLLDMYSCEDIAELVADDNREAQEWGLCCAAMARAESNYFERNDEHRNEMEWQDALGYT